MYHQPVLAAVVIAGTHASSAPPASASPCRQSDRQNTPQNPEAERATLALDERSSKTNLWFKRERSDREISLASRPPAASCPRRSRTQGYGYSLSRALGNCRLAS